jgi:hypothetical protein
MGLWRARGPGRLLRVYSAVSGGDSRLSCCGQAALGPVASNRLLSLAIIICRRISRSLWLGVRTRRQGVVWLDMGDLHASLTVAVSKCLLDTVRQTARSRYEYGFRVHFIPAVWAAV